MAKYDDRSLSDKLTDLSGLFKKWWYSSFYKLKITIISFI